MLSINQKFVLVEAAADGVFDRRRLRNSNGDAIDVDDDIMCVVWALRALGQNRVVSRGGCGEARIISAKEGYAKHIGLSNTETYKHSLTGRSHWKCQWQLQQGTKCQVLSLLV